VAEAANSPMRPNTEGPTENLGSPGIPTTPGSRVRHSCLRGSTRHRVHTLGDLPDSPIHAATAKPRQSPASDQRDQIGCPNAAITLKLASIRLMLKAMQSLMKSPDGL
jgi:hypothetical protein